MMQTSTNNIFLVGLMGSGKTTIVPLALLDADWLLGRILVLEPRRLATRAAARRMASLLGERVGIHRWSAVAVGFIGVLIVFRPDEGLFQWGALLSLSAGLMVSALHISARILGRTDHPVTTVLYMAGGGTLLLSIAVPFHWVTPDWHTVFLMIVSGIFASAGHFGVLTAIRMAQLSAISPFSYTQIITATALGYVVFGEVPQTMTLLGLAVIVGSGFYILHRERVRAREKALGVA